MNKCVRHPNDCNIPISSIGASLDTEGNLRKYKKLRTPKLNIFGTSNVFPPHLQEAED